MKKSEFTRTTKLGANASDKAKRAVKVANNHKQSRDIHEDRGTMQSRLGATKPTTKPSRKV
jgi:hypothetical protein